MEATQLLPQHFKSSVYIFQEICSIALWHKTGRGRCLSSARADGSGAERQVGKFIISSSVKPKQKIKC